MAFTVIIFYPFVGCQNFPSVLSFFSISRVLEDSADQIQEESELTTTPLLLRGARMSSAAKWDPVVFMTTIAGTSQTLSKSRSPLYGQFDQ